MRRAIMNYVLRLRSRLLMRHAAVGSSGVADAAMRGNQARPCAP